MANREVVTGLCAGERNERKKRVRERQILPSTARPGAMGATVVAAAVRLRAEGEKSEMNGLGFLGAAVGVLFL
jgi:hypothetical protein